MSKCSIETKIPKFSVGMIALISSWREIKLRKAKRFHPNPYSPTKRETPIHSPISMKANSGDLPKQPRMKETKLNIFKGKVKGM